MGPSTGTCRPGALTAAAVLEQYAAIARRHRARSAANGSNPFGALAGPSFSSPLSGHDPVGGGAPEGASQQGSSATNGGPLGSHGSRPGCRSSGGVQGGPNPPSGLGEDDVAGKAREPVVPDLDAGEAPHVTRWHDVFLNWDQFIGKIEWDLDRADEPTGSLARLVLRLVGEFAREEVA